MSGKTRPLADVFEANRHLYGRVPQLDAAAVCSACLGPVAGDFPRCYSCHCLFGNENAPSEIADAIVPMTTAINPGDWYARLVGYKNGNIEFQLTLIALVHTFISTHAPRIERFLGGAPDIITIVPSTSVPVERQPLWRTLHKVEQPNPRLGIVLRHRPARVIGRSLYRPSAFKVVETAVAQKRVLLIEDLWVSGATAVSAAGSLLKAGARSVALLPIARELRPPGKFRREDPWYYVERNGTYNVHDWPRP